MRCPRTLLALALGATSEAARIITNTNTTQYPGSADCLCIGIDRIEGSTVANLKNGGKTEYPADMGARCEAWDAKRHPKCPGESWCEEHWCYVDPCKCKGVSVLPKPAIYVPGAQFQGKPVYYSYATCGSKDTYSKEEEKKSAEEIAATCKAPVDKAVWGEESCRCIGVTPQDGITKVHINGSMVDFPADTGASCKAWEKDNHPECAGDKPPAWCSQKWCYVDPCKCKLPTPPKTSTYVPHASWQGKPVYYSYATCGGKDAFTEGRKEACVNQESKEDCVKLSKCAWTGAECLGKELATACHQ